MDRKLSALSELLRADTENERRSAVRLIEIQTNKHFDVLLERGIKKTLKGEQQEIAKRLTATYAGDVLVQAIGVVLQKNSISWANLVRSGNRLSVKERIAQALGQKINDGTKWGDVQAVRRDALPCSAKGIPIIWEEGKTFDGDRNAIFYLEEAETAGRTFKPTLPLCVEGDDMVDAVKKAACNKHTLQFGFQDPGAKSDLVRATPS